MSPCEFTMSDDKKDQGVVVTQPGQVPEPPVTIAVTTATSDPPVSCIPASGVSSSVVVPMSSPASQASGSSTGASSTWCRVCPQKLSQVLQ